MTTYYVDNVGGNSANDGLTPGTAKAHPLDLVGIIADLDILRQKATGVDYQWNAPGANTAVFGAVRFLWTRYTGDTTNPVNEHIKNSTNSYVISSLATINVVNVDTYVDYNNSTNTASPINFTTSTSGNVLFQNCKITLDKYKGGTPTNRTTIHQFQITSNTNGKCQLENTVVDGLDHQNVWNFNNTGANASIAIRSQFIRMAFNTTSPLARFVVATKNILDIAFSGNNGYILRAGNTGIGWFYRKNTIIIRDGGFTTSGCRVFDFNITPALFFADNICYNLDTSNTHYLYGASTSQTQNAMDVFMTGVNPYYGLTYSNNITDLVENLGTSDVMGGSPFLSTTIGDADYVKLDPSNTDAQDYCIGKAYMDTNEDCGAISADSPAPTSSVLTFNQKLQCKNISEEIRRKMPRNKYDEMTVALSSADTVETYTFKLATITVATLTATFATSVRQTPTSLIWS